MAKVVNFSRVKEYPFASEEEKRIHEEMCAIINADDVIEKLNAVTDEDIDRAFGVAKETKVDPEDLIAYL